MNAEQEFTKYFVENYPGPETIIHDPNWHAPKIFRAAKAALESEAAALEKELKAPGPCNCHPAMCRDEGL